MIKKELHITHRRGEGGGCYAKRRHLLGRLFAQSRHKTTGGGRGGSKIQFLRRRRLWMFPYLYHFRNLLIFATLGRRHRFTPPSETSGRIQTRQYNGSEGTASSASTASLFFSWMLCFGKGKRLIVFTTDYSIWYTVMRSIYIADFSM